MISVETLRKDVSHLTETIGVRLAGSPAELEAAKYMQKRFLENVPQCTIEEFPIRERAVEREELEVLVGNEWLSFPANLFNSAPGTDGKTVEAEMVIFHSRTDYQREDLSYLTGKAVVHLGVHIKREEDYRRLMEAKPAFLLMVDIRYTGKTPLADGLFPTYVEKYGAVPTVNVAYFDAWKWCAEGASKARLTVVGASVPATSYNVVAEIPGTDPNALCIYCGSHIDSQAYTVGADDNATGSAVLLSLAEELAKKPHRHTIRLIGFGAEEQLSVGSSQYIRRHREEIEAQGKFMCNFDSCSTPMGWNTFIMNADPALREQLAEHHHGHGIYYEEMLVPDPTNDLFPFVVLGVPGVTALRRNCESGKFYHHQPTDTIANVSFDIVKQIATSSLEWIEKLADDPNLCDLPGTDPTKEETVQALWSSTFGGW